MKASFPSQKKLAAARVKTLMPSKAFAAIVGHEPLPKVAAVARAWDYIEQHGCRDPRNRREIIADDALKAVFGKERVSLSEMGRLFAVHLS